MCNGVQITVRSWRGILSSICIGIFFAAGQVTAAGSAPLFEREDKIEVAIQAPFRDISSSSMEKREEFPGTLTLTDADGTITTFTVKYSARGVSRRNKDVCRFPPLRVNFQKGEVKETLFAGQNKLKIVTYCQSRSKFEPLYVKEYIVYKFYNLLTPLSFQVRAANITYLDANGKGKPITRFGFFIEDVDDVAKRNGLVEYSMPKVSSSRIAEDVGARTALFQYMIANLDWSSIRGPNPLECCHNTKLLGRADDPSAPITPVPYDFDASGFVNAPYAMPPEGLPARRVTDRVYRGFCKHNGGLNAAVADAQAQRGDILSIIMKSAELDEKTRKKAVKFIEDFYETIGNAKNLERKIYSSCRGKKKS